MSDRRFIIGEFDQADADFGKMFALNPGTAGGVGIPAFSTVATTPAAGNVVGEAIINTTNNSALVWDGNHWVPIVPAAIIPYATDAALLGDVNQPAGSYGSTQDTGNMYIKTAAGWRIVGIRIYANAAALLAATPVNHSLGMAADENTLWVYVGAAWRCITTRPMATGDDIIAWTTAPNHTVAIAQDTGVQMMMVRGATGPGVWRPLSIWNALTLQQIQAATWPQTGQIAVATATGDAFVRVGPQWLQIGGARPPIGEIIAYPSVTPPAGFLLCDGSTLDANQYPVLAGLCGARLPNLQHHFIRGARNQNEITGFNRRDDTTRMPRNPFTAAAQHAGGHHHGVEVKTWSGDFAWQGGDEIVLTPGTGVTNPHHVWYNTGTDGDHTHNITISGGDAETLPPHIYMAYMIRHD
jgi:hypothetical protein